MKEKSQRIAKLHKIQKKINRGLYFIKSISIYPSLLHCLFRGWCRGSHPEALGAEQDGERWRPGGVSDRWTQEQGGLHQAGGYSIPGWITDRFKRGSTDSKPELLQLLFNVNIYQYQFKKIIMSCNLI